jgi:hypothetical protein
LLNHIVFSPAIGIGGGLYYPKQQNSSFQELERSLGPYPVCLVPENCGDDGAEADYEEIFTAETCQEKHKESNIEYGAKQGVEEVSWEQELAELHVVFEDPNFYLADKHIVSADILFLD